VDQHAVVLSVRDSVVVQVVITGISEGIIVRVELCVRQTVPIGVHIVWVSHPKTVVFRVGYAVAVAVRCGLGIVQWRGRAGGVLRVAVWRFCGDELITSVTYSVPVGIVLVICNIGAVVYSATDLGKF
jgi:hypothetical protein